MIIGTDQQLNGLLHELGSSPSLELFTQRLDRYMKIATHIMLPMSQELLCVFYGYR